MLHHSFILLDANFNKSIIELDFLLIRYMLAKFQDNRISITILSIKCLNFKFLHLKLYLKDEFLKQIVNRI